MTRLKVILFALLSLACVPAYAQRAVLVQLPSGQMIGVAYGPGGQTIVLTDVQVLKLPDPTPPAPSLRGPVWVITIKSHQGLTADQAATLLDLRTWADEQPADKVSFHEYYPGAVGPDGNPDAGVAAFVARIPATAKLPYVFITRLKSDGKSSVTFWEGELPASADPVIEKAKEKLP